MPIAPLPLRYFRSLVPRSLHPLRSLAALSKLRGWVRCPVVYSARTAKMSGVRATFELGPEAIQTAVPATPDRGDPRHCVAQGLGAHVESHLPARALALDQPGLGELLQVLHHCLAAD